jgi:hypothetical protein
MQGGRTQVEMRKRKRVEVFASGSSSREAAAR